MEIIYSLLYKKSSGDIWGILYGSTSEKLKFTLYRIMISLFLSIIVIVSGIIIVMVKVFMNKNLNKSLLYLGVFFFLVSSQRLILW